MSRNTQVKMLRPQVNTDNERDSLNEELFQNETLRPILKFQNELILSYFKHKVADVKVSNLANERIVFVGNVIKNDAVLRNQLIGMVIGLFSDEEFLFYLANATSVNKRMSQLLIKRIQDQF